MAIVNGVGPDGLPSSLVLTVDNLGEAGALERGDWPANATPWRELARSGRMWVVPGGVFADWLRAADPALPS
jgi:hypothetical protein